LPYAETVWRLLERSGLTRSAIRARYEGKVGVYIGATGTDIAELANSISSFFDLEGPSIAVDTMCSSSAMAIHLACRALAWSALGLAVLWLVPNTQQLMARFRPAFGYDVASRQRQQSQASTGR